MSEKTNPYALAGPVERNGRFYGREECFGWLEARMASRERSVMALFGPRLIGKSSFVCQLARRLRAPDLLLLIDVGSWGHSPDRLMELTLSAVQEALQVSEDAGRKEPAAWVAGLEGAASQRRVLAVLEGIEIETEEDSAALAGFVKEVKAHVGHGSWLDILLVIDAEGPPAGLMSDGLFAGDDLREMELLAREDAARLITEPARGRLTFENRAVRRIFELASGHPFFTRLLCQVLYDRSPTDGYVWARDVDDAIGQVLALGDDELRAIWEAASEDERAMLQVLSELKGVRGVFTLAEARHAAGDSPGPAPDGSGAALGDLERRRVLVRLGASSFRFSVELFRLWVLQHKASETLVEKRPGVTAGPPDEGDRRRLRVVRAALAIAAAAFAGLTLLALGTWLWGAGGPEDSAALAARVTPEPSVGGVYSSWVVIEEPTLRALMPTATHQAILAHIKPVVAYMYKESQEDDWDIYSMEIGGAPQPLASDPADESFPAWSPDGQHLAFVSDRSGDREVYRMRADGAQVTNLTSHPDEDWTPTWSPDGRRIAFASMRDGNWEIYVMNGDGSDQVRLTHDEGSDFSPCWSPDGSQIAFVSNRDENWEIYAMNPDGSGQVRLTEDEATDISPAWSPDGSRIAFESYRDGDMEIYVMARDGAEPLNLTNDAAADDHGPAWTPDGASLLYYSNRDGGWDLFRITAKGTGIENLTRSGGLEQSPVMKPR